MNDSIAISGHLKNEQELNTVTSGGLATALEKYVIQNGGVAYAVTYTPDYRDAEYIEVTNQETVERAKGTKYIQAKTRLSSGVSVYDACIENLKKGTLVLFTGLPCNVYKLKRMIDTQQVDDTRLYTVDLICHGPTHKEVQEQFVEFLEEKYQSRLSSLNLRTKDYGWKTAYIRADFENGQTYIEKFNTSYFGIAFNLYPKNCAYKCIFKGDNRLSDITIGDHWGIASDAPSFHINGTSVGFVHTEKAEQLLKELDNFFYTCTDVNAGP